MSAALPLPDITDRYLQLQPIRSRANDAILYSVVGLLVLAPLAFGAVEIWATSIFEFGAAILFSIWVLRQIRAGTLILTGNPAFLPICAFGAIVLLQLVFGVSAYTHATSSACMVYAAYAITCFLITQTLTRTTHIRYTATVFTAFGTFVALFAVLQSLSSNGKIYWLRTPRFGGWIYGPYVNHNHYAGLMEMLAPIPLVFAFSKYAHGRNRWMAAAAAAFMGATIFLSGSRGGMAAYALQIALFLWFLFRERTRNGIALVMGAFLLVALVSVAWIGGSEVTNRISTVASNNKQTEIGSDIRFAIDRDSLYMFAKRPVLGWGLGTFADVYPEFRSFYTNQLVNRAHNDYLEFLTNTGILGFGIGIWFLVAVLRPAIRKARNWSGDVNGAVALATLLGISGILVHSFVDSNLQIPANAMLFYVLCALGAADTRFRNPRREQRRHSRVEVSTDDSAVPL